MSLRDRTPKLSGKPGRVHRVEEILAELEPEDADALRGWLADLNYSPERIRAELVDEGIPVSVNAIASYRYGVLGIGERRR